MKNFKKITALLLAMAMLFSFAACGNDYGNTVYSQALDAEGYYTGFDMADYIEVCDYSKITISESMIKSYEEQFMSQYSQNVVLDPRPLVDQDTVNIDYVGYVDGVAFDGGSTQGQGTTVQIGVTSYIDGFLDQLIGHNVGDEFTITVTFPDPYINNPDLAGKEAQFDITINTLYGKTTPTLTDSWVQENLYENYGYSSVADVKTYLISNATIDYLLNNSKITDIPEPIINNCKELLKKRYEDYTAQYSMTLGEYVSMCGFDSVDAFLEYNYYTYYVDAIEAFLLQAVAEKEDIKVTNDDIREYFKETTGNSYYTEAKKQYGLPYLKNIVINSKVKDLLLGNVEVAMD